MAGVKEVWFVLVPEKQIEVHSEPGEDHYTEKSLSGPGGTFSRPALPGFALDLGWFFASESSH
jgi:Uma2 family endonuclease